MMGAKAPAVVVFADKELQAFYRAYASGLESARVMDCHEGPAWVRRGQAGQPPARGPVHRGEPRRAHGSQNVHRGGEPEQVPFLKEPSISQGERGYCRESILVVRISEGYTN